MRPRQRPTRSTPQPKKKADDTLDELTKFVGLAGTAQMTKGTPRSGDDKGNSPQPAAGNIYPAVAPAPKRNSDNQGPQYGTARWFPLQFPLAWP